MLTTYRYTALDDPLAVSGFSFTTAYGINSSGQIVGSYRDVVSGATHGFLYSGGTYTTLDVPSATLTEARAINDSVRSSGPTRRQRHITSTAAVATPSC